MTACGRRRLVGGRAAAPQIQPCKLVVAALMPLATGLYLLTTTAWSAAERAIVARRMRTAAAPEPGEPRGGRM